VIEPRDSAMLLKKRKILVFTVLNVWRPACVYFFAPSRNPLWSLLTIYEASFLLLNGAALTGFKIAKRRAGREARSAS
jgi:hypothetical protein